MPHEFLSLSAWNILIYLCQPSSFKALSWMLPLKTYQRCPSWVTARWSCLCLLIRVLPSPLRIAPPVCGAWPWTEALLHVFHPSNPRGGYHHPHFIEEKLRFRKPHQDPSVASAMKTVPQHLSLCVFDSLCLFLLVDLCVFGRTLPLLPLSGLGGLSIWIRKREQYVFIIHYSLMSFKKLIHFCCLVSTMHDAGSLCVLF